MDGISLTVNDAKTGQKGLENVFVSVAEGKSFGRYNNVRPHFRNADHDPAPAAPSSPRSAHFHTARVSCRTCDNDRDPVSHGEEGHPRLASLNGESHLTLPPASAAIPSMISLKVSRKTFSFFFDLLPLPSLRTLSKYASYETA